MSRIERLFVGLMFCAAGCAPTSPIDPGTTETGPPDVGHLVDTAAPQSWPAFAILQRVSSLKLPKSKSTKKKRAARRQDRVVARRAGPAPGYGTGPYAKQAVPKAWKP